MTGGREYDIIVNVRDKAGIVATANLTTPYIREFENIAPLDDKIVIANYYTWYEKPSEPGNHWYDGSGRRIHIYSPSLGEYASGDPIVIYKHIDWATGHGIDAFAISWWTTGNDERTWDYHNTRNLDAFLRNPLIKDIKFCILYENNGRLRISNPDNPSFKWIEDLNDPFNRQRLISDFEFLADNYFQHPSYLRIRGKPVADFDYTIPFRGDITAAFSEVRAKLKNKGFDVYLVNDLMGRNTSPYGPNEYGVSEAHFRKLTEVFDAISGSNFPGAYDNIDKDIQHVKMVYENWRKYAKDNDKDFIPAVWPGTKDVLRSPERLRRQFELAKRYTTVNVVSIISFNEWIAGHQIEPSYEEGDIYLKNLS
jgi:hypothetical protein